MRFRDVLAEPCGLEPVIQWGIDRLDVGGGRDGFSWYGALLLLLGWCLPWGLIMFMVSVARWVPTWGRATRSPEEVARLARRRAAWVTTWRRCVRCGRSTPYVYRELCGDCFHSGRPGIVN